MTETDHKSDGQPYELFVFARRHGINLEQARRIIARYGSDRPGADAAAKAAKQTEFKRATTRH